VLEIAGRRAASLGLAAPDIRMTSDPDSLDPSYARATVCIVPVLGGCGVRLKLLEAIAYGVPVVTTPLGADGTAFEHGRHLQVATGAEDFAASVLRCLDGDPELRTAAAAARALLARNHDPASVADAFERHLLQACSGAVAPLPERNGTSARRLEMSTS
jgi:glycosyltransferase involved in cell wall biosynthesis